MTSEAGVRAAVAWIPRPRLLSTRVAAILELTKPRLTGLAVAAAIAGYLLGGSSGGSSSAMGALCVALGAFLVGGGANALNQVMERDLDAMMSRTRGRPLPSGRVTPGEAWIFGALAALGGVIALAASVGRAPAAAATCTLALYLAVYTPMKRRSVWNTLIGAVPGALPVMIGWSASGARATPLAWVVFGVVVLWQLPHFFAICRLWQEDYRLAGYAMWPLRDATGRRTGWTAAGLCAVMTTLSIVPVAMGDAGWGYGAAAVLLGVLFGLTAARMGVNASARTARGCFLASIVYLPLWMGALLLERLM